MRTILLVMLVHLLAHHSLSQTRETSEEQFKKTFPNSLYLWNTDLGTPHRVIGSDESLDLEGDDPDLIVEACLDFLDGRASGLFVNREDLMLRRCIQVKGKWYVDFAQHHDGVLVHGSEIIFRLGFSGKILAWGMDYFRELNEANIRFTEEKGDALFPRMIEGQQLFDPAEFQKILSFGSVTYRYVSLIDGAVLWESRKHCDMAVQGSVQGQILPVLSTDPQLEMAMPHLDVHLNNETVTTDANGNFNIELTEDIGALTARLKGSFVDVQHFLQQDAQITMEVSDGQTVELVWNDQNSDISERNVYYHSNLAHDYLKEVDSGFTGLDYPLVCIVEDNQATCNAYWNGNNIHYNPEGGACVMNSAHGASVVYHEYGHAINDRFYQQQGAITGLNSITLHEALADITSCLMLDEPQFALGWFGPGTFTRNLDNSNIYPQSVVGQQHTDGLILGGAFWDLRELTTPEIAYNLAHYAKYGLPDDPDLGTAFGEYYLETLIADDDNGDLSDGTPHFAEINTAFCMHGIGMNLYLNDDITHVPPSDYQPANESVEISAELNLQGVFLDYLGDSELIYSTDNFESSEVVLMSADGNELTATIPGQDDGTVVKYYFSFEESLCGGEALSPGNDPQVFAHNFWIGDYTSYFKHDFESNEGWQVGIPTDQATNGVWEWADPVAIQDGTGTTTQPGNDYSPNGTMCLVTGAQQGPLWYSEDVDGGATTVTSPVFSAVEGEETIFQFYHWFLHGTPGVPPVAGSWKIQITNNGLNWVDVEETQYGTSNSWRRGLYKVSNLLDPTDQMQIRVIANDPNPGSIVEALFDDFEVLHFGEPASIAMQSDSDLRIYPIPADDQLTIATSKKQMQSISMQDCRGRTCLEMSQLTSAIMRIDVSLYPSGIYSLRVQFEDKSFAVKKVVLQ